MNTNVQLEIETLLQSTQSGYKEHDIGFTVPGQLGSDESLPWSNWNSLDSKQQDKTNSFQEKKAQPSFSSFWQQWWQRITKGKTAVDGESPSSGEEEELVEDVVEEREVGGEAGEIACKYVVKGIHPSEMAVIGTYIDKRVVPGFAYRIRLLPAQEFLFNGKALTLQSVAMGYGKRLTFRGATLNHNENYFWSDSAPLGYGFMIEALKAGHRFGVYASDECRPMATAVVDAVDCIQQELSMTADETGVTKRVAVTFTATLSYGTDPHGVLPLATQETLDLTGVVVMVKRRRQKLATIKHVEGVILPNIGSCVLYTDTDAI